MLAKLSEAVFVDILDSVEVISSANVYKTFSNSLRHLFEHSSARQHKLQLSSTLTRGWNESFSELIVHLYWTYTLFAHLVTLLPSFKHFISPCPAFSVLHCIKSSLYGLHLAPIKKLADSNGAELAPISVTGGMSVGRGAVSIKVVWLNLQLHRVSNANTVWIHLNGGNIHRFSARHLVSYS